MIKNILAKIKKLVSGNGGLSFSAIAGLAYWVFICLILVALFLDGWVFYKYGYTAVNLSAEGTYQIQFKKGELNAIISVLDARKKEFNSIIETLKR